MITDDTVPDLLRAATDPGQAVQVLTQQFPGIEIWYGAYTRHYQALHNGQRLDAPSPAQLYRQLRERRPAQ